MNTLELGIRYYLNRIFKQPFYVAFRLTNNCHLNCSYCPIQRKKTTENDKEMNLSEINLLANHLNQMNISYLLLTGGEPLRHPHFLEVVDIFSKYKLPPIRLQTSGDLLTKNLIDIIIKKGISDFSLSLDQLDTTKHYGNRLQNINKTKIMITYLSKKYPKKNKIIVNTVISPNNIDQIENIILWVNQQGATSTISPISPDWGNKNFDDNYKSKLLILLDRLTILKQNGANILNTNIYFSNLKNSLITNNISWKCHAYKDYIEIGSDGSIFPCSELKPYGNILDEHFLKNYSQGRENQIIKNQIKSCNGCLYSCYREVSSIRDLNWKIEKLISFIK